MMKHIQSIEMKCIQEYEKLKEHILVQRAMYYQNKMIERFMSTYIDIVEANYYTICHKLDSDLIRNKDVTKCLDNTDKILELYNSES